jgi:hypothetical protein
MTKIQRHLTRETECLERRRPIIVQLFPFHCGLRLKGTRQFYAVSWGAVLDLARKQDAWKKLEERRAGRKAS